MKPLTAKRTVNRSDFSRYAASLGYFEDPFTKCMSKSKPKKMYPIINRGTWTRVHAYRRALHSFVSLPGEKQIISFGAGLDTSYFYLRYKYPEAKIKYVEVDFAEIVSKKLTIISKNPVLAQYKQELDGYSLLSCDLRDLHKLSEEFVKIKVDPKVQTLILTECVLVYMEPAHSQELVSWCGKFFEHAAILNYEMINPFDPFGKMMVENIEVTRKQIIAQSRGCKLSGLKEFATLEKQKTRFSQTFTRVDAITLLEFYDKYADKEEKARIEKIEIFDEFEEWNILQSHYCLVLATKGDINLTF